MADPTVKLTFAGDSSGAVKAMNDIQQEAKEVDTAVRSSGEGMNRAAEGFDNTETRALGFKDTLDGLGGSLEGIGEISRGNTYEGLLLLGQGVADFAGGVANFAIPALQRFGGWLAKTRVGSLALAAAQNVVRVATAAWAAVQRVLNAVLNANPIMKVVGLLTILGGALAAAWAASETFRNIVRGVWNAVWGTVKRVVGWIGDAVGGMWDGIVSGIQWAYDQAKGILDAVVDAAQWAARQVKEAMDFLLGSSKIQGMIDDAARGAGISVPRRHSGGVVPGSSADEHLMLLRGGETVKPNTFGARGGAQTVTLRAGDDMSAAILAVIRKAVRQQGGDVQVVLGRG